MMTLKRKKSAVQEIKEVVITKYKALSSKFTAQINLREVGKILTPIRPLDPDEVAANNAKFGTYGNGIGSDFNVIWKQIKNLPNDLADAFENIKNISESENKEEVIIATAILAVNLKKGKIGNITRMGSWPWGKSATIKQLIKASCDLDAKKIQQAIGGKIITVSNPIPGLRLGPVKVGDGVVTEWFYHKAVQKEILSMIE